MWENVSSRSHHSNAVRHLYAFHTLLQELNSRVENNEGEFIEIDKQFRDLMERFNRFGKERFGISYREPEPVDELHEPIKKYEEIKKEGKKKCANESHPFDRRKKKS